MDKPPAQAAVSSSSRRLATAIVISRIRWAFIPLAFVGVLTNVPPPVNPGAFLAALAFLAACNTALTFHARLPEGFAQPFVALAMAADVVMVTVTMFEFAADPTDLGWAFLMLVGPAAAVLYGWAGVRWFVPPMILALIASTFVGGQLAAPNGLVGLVHKALEVLGVTVIVAALVEQNERQRRDVERVNRELERLTVSDPLTGVANRRLFEASWKQERARVRRTGLPVAMVIADIDHFKLVNDQFGHPAGDDVLRKVSACVLACARDIDLVARIGGEEFACLLPGTDEAGAQAFGERIRAAVAALVLDQPTLRCTISVGVASSSTTDLEELVVGADRALYRAKAGGRDRVEVWTGELRAASPGPTKSKSMHGRFDAGHPVAEVAQAVGVSPRTAHRVYKRWLLDKATSPAAGEADLAPPAEAAPGAR